MGLSSLGRGILKYKFHWHVLLVHFPISFFGVAFGFQILHLFWSPACFELATNVALAFGVVMMVPTTWAGWSSWKNNYKGAGVKLFQYKITTAFVMLVLGVVLVSWRFIFLGFFTEAHISPQHWIYLAGNTVLIIGAIIEGYFGGRLNHR